MLTLVYCKGLLNNKKDQVINYRIKYTFIHLNRGKFWKHISKSIMCDIVLFSEEPSFHLLSPSIQTTRGRKLITPPLQRRI